MASALTRWDSFADIAELRGRFDRLLEEFGAGREREWTPSIDMVRDNGNLVVRADVPGIKPDEIRIEAHEGFLTISGEHEKRRARGRPRPCPRGCASTSRSTR